MKQIMIDASFRNSITKSISVQERPKTLMPPISTNLLKLSPTLGIPKPKVIVNNLQIAASLMPKTPMWNQGETKIVNVSTKVSEGEE